MTTLDPRFKFVFIIVVFLTIGMLVANGVLVFTFSDLTKNQETLIDNLSRGWQMGIAAVLGLIGGKKIE